MKKAKHLRVQWIVQSAMIAAAYVVLTFVSATFNLAYFPVQFRLSEALTILPIFTPAAIPGLALGCLISNLTSPLGMIDWIIGTLATLIAAVCTRCFANVQVKGIPWLSLIPPVLINMILVGFELSLLSDAGAIALTNFKLPVFLVTAASVGIGELAVVAVVGIPLILALKRINAERLFSLRPSEKQIM